MPMSEKRTARETEDATHSRPFGGSRVVVSRTIQRNILKRLTGRRGSEQMRGKVAEDLHEKLWRSVERRWQRAEKKRAERAEKARKAAA